MSATNVHSRSTVRVGARSTVWVSQEIVNTLFKIIGGYGLSEGCLINTPEVVPRGVMVWLAARQLKSVTLELLDRDGKLARKFVLPIDYTCPGDEEEVFKSNLQSLENFMKGDRPGSLGKYRVLASMNCNPWIRVPGWGEGKASDASHLKQQQLSDDFIKASGIQVGLMVFTGNAQNSGEAR